MRADALLAEAISSHQQGKHKEAEASYRAVLEKHPTNFTALHHLGVLALGQNKLDEAHGFITRALGLMAHPRKRTITLEMFCGQRAKRKRPPKPIGVRPGSIPGTRERSATSPSR